MALCHLVCFLRPVKTPAVRLGAGGHPWVGAYASQLGEEPALLRVEGEQDSVVFGSREPGGVGVELGELLFEFFDGCHMFRLLYSMHYVLYKATPSHADPSLVTGRTGPFQFSTVMTP